MEIARPLAATAVLSALLVLGALSLSASWADFSSAEDELAAKADMVSGSVQTIRSSVSADAPQTTARLFVEADSETLAAAQVDALVRLTTTEAGGLMLSSRTDAKHDDGALAGRIEAVAEIEAQNDVLQAILLKLETGAPLLMVQNLAVQPVQSLTGSADPAPRLRADVTLVAYWNATKPRP